MKSVLMTLLLVSSTSFAATPVVQSVSGNCEKEIFTKSEEHIGPSSEDFEFQGFGDISEGLEDNEFNLSYGFNDECQGGVTVTIKPLKVIQKLNRLKQRSLEATECKVEKIVDDAADCG